MLRRAAGVGVMNAASFAIERVIAVGDHPCEMVEAPDGSRLFVTNANQNTISMVELPRGRVTETLSSAPDPGAPPGSTPNAVALDHEGRRLLVANADNNCLALF